VNITDLFLGPAGEGEEVEEVEGGDGAKKKRTARIEATLAKTPAQLHTKKLDLEFAVDPLFKKTSEDFDEGGAQGLLMNHLAVDNNLRVVFDASDTPGGADEDEPEEAVTILIPLDALRSKLDLANIAERSVMSSRLADFKFSSDPANNDYSIDGASRNREEEMDSADEAEFQDPVQVDMIGDYGDGGESAEPLPAPGGTEDFFSGDQAIEDYPLDFGGASYDQGGEDGEMGEEGMETRAGAPLAPFDPRHAPNPTELVMAIADGGSQDMLDYFDASVIKNWAGPEHWKMRKVIRKGQGLSVASYID
jgi:condensin complex subunit 2